MTLGELLRYTGSHTEYEIHCMGEVVIEANSDFIRWAKNMDEVNADIYHNINTDIDKIEVLNGILVIHTKYWRI